MCKLDYKESWAPKNWCFWTMVLQETLESPLDCREIQRVNPKRNQSWVLIGRTDAGAETPVLWPSTENNWLLWKDPDARKDWRQEEKGTTGWDGWMASLTRWTWVWTSSRSWWWTGKPVVLQSTGSQRVRHNWVTELTDWLYSQCEKCFIPVTYFVTKSLYLWSVSPVTLILLFYFPLATPVCSLCLWVCFCFVCSFVF